jgi:hypothetical protein
MSAASTGKEEAITRSWNGLDIPVPGTWEFDPAHTSIIVVGRHSMIVKVRGRFNEFSGRIHIAESPEDSWVEATIQAASVDSGVQMRDDHMRSPDFLEVERFPTFSFRSTGIALGEGSSLRVAADLTIRDWELEAGTRWPSFETWDRICKLYGWPQTFVGAPERKATLASGRVAPAQSTRGHGH